MKWLFPVGIIGRSTNTVAKSGAKVEYRLLREFRRDWPCPNDRHRSSSVTQRGSKADPFELNLLEPDSALPRGNANFLEQDPHDRAIPRVRSQSLAAHSLCPCRNPDTIRSPTELQLGVLFQGLPYKCRTVTPSGVTDAVEYISRTDFG